MIKKYIQLLNKILKNDNSKIDNIIIFQNLVWNDSCVNDQIKDLAYDLDFFQPDIKIRKIESAYFDDIELEKRIVAVINKLKS